ncbi:MAG: carbohydrate ABC transporter permease [Bacillota bacterium]|nr:carbohydrate ABC transporter permease [Bacillota bacterium]
MAASRQVTYGAITEIAARLRASMHPGARGVPVMLVWARRLQNLFFRALLYLVLTGIAFTFLLPIIYMASTGLKTVEDYIDPGVRWVPTALNYNNFVVAYQGLAYLATLRNSSLVAVASSLGQIISCSMIGYAFARIRFPGREILFMLVLFTFIVPPQTIVVPLFILYRRLGWIDTYWPFIVPGFLGHGLRGALFILIFRQFFRRLPWELEDAARIDGCNEFQTYLRIMLPLARPAILVTFLFSLVWHWNDFYEPMMYLMKLEKFTMPLRLRMLQTGLMQIYGGQGANLMNEPLVMAAALLVIAPPLVLYVFTQRYFVESIERTGLVD